MKQEVQAWQQWIELPTYETGKPGKNPLFLEKRVYQGSSGVVYPHPVIEKICDEKINKRYCAFFIENEYLRIMVLPELGGRIHRAYDKIRQRDFVYYNQVIKPALVGLTGPWISGGIEFNWPQHHRPGTFLPIDCTIEENKDGSKTIWVNEIEIMFRTKGMAGFTLYPDKAYLEVKGKIFNRTSLRQSFLWWANPAVKVNEHYQSVFPPDVNAVFDHGKRDVSDFPIATGRYYKVDYSPGTDISRYKNIPVPTSFMAVQSEYDFIGCYEHDTNAGMVHIADHHISPGKKQWTWGNGDFGKAWDKNLTDDDGPYAELMTGMFTDNQPDFTWLQPNEQKEFQQYFMPYAGTGGIKNATKHSVINVEKKDDKIIIKLYATAVYKNAKVKVCTDGKQLAFFLCRFSPHQIFDKAISLSPGISFETITVTVSDAEGNLLVSYKPAQKKNNEIPQPAKAAELPKEIDSIEQLYLTGIHLEQYRHATFEPADYYSEALKREPGDSRCNNAMGLLLLRRGQFLQAEPFFRSAIETLNERNSNPTDGEPYYNLGLCLQLQNRFDEAYDAFYKSIWSDAWQHSGFLALARIAARNEKWKEALQFADQSLLRNSNSHSARHLKIILLRKTNRYKEAASLIKESLQADPFNYGAYYEQYLLLKETQAKKAAGLLQKIKAMMGNSVQTILEYAIDYSYAGLYSEAADLIQCFYEEDNQLSPLPLYYLGWFADMQNDKEGAMGYYIDAGKLPADYCFPNKIEEILILKNVIEVCPDNAKPYYYLGNLWYDKKQYREAIDCWGKSVSIDTTFPTVHRNLALASFNKEKNAEKAITFLEKAFALDKSDSRVLMELDQLYKVLNMPIGYRLNLLEENSNAVNERDDLYLEKITLLNLSGKFEEAKALILARKFHPWEGGEGKVPEQYFISVKELSLLAMKEDRLDEVLSLLLSAATYPENFGEGKLFGKPENDMHYLTGCAYLLSGNEIEAADFFEKATQGSPEPVQAVFYNDPQPDKIFYQGLAWYRLGQIEKARSVFERLISFGIEHMDDIIRIDYFAVSLPDLLVFEQDLQERNRIHCFYLQALGHLGLGEFEIAEDFFSNVSALQCHHAGAHFHSHLKKFLVNTGAIPAFVTE